MLEFNKKIISNHLSPKNTLLYFIVTLIILIVGVLLYSIYQSEKLKSKIGEEQQNVSEITNKFSKLNVLYKRGKTLNIELTSLNHLQRQENENLTEIVAHNQNEITVIKAEMLRKSRQLKKILKVISIRDNQIRKLRVKHIQAISGIKKELKKTRKLESLREGLIDSLSGIVTYQQNLKTKSVEINTFSDNISNGASKVLRSSVIKQVRVIVQLTEGISKSNKLRVVIYNNGVKYTRFSYSGEMKRGNIWFFDFKIANSNKLTKGVLLAKVFCDRLYIGDTFLQLN